MKHKHISTSSLRLLAVATACLTASSVHATDYSFGSVTENFTITASDQARVLGAGVTATGTLSPDYGAVYDRGANRDTTYMHFNLSSLSGMTINGDVNLNFVINAQYGGAINNGIIGTAANTWTTSSATPGINTFTPVVAPNGNYSQGQTATWTIGNSTFTGILGDLANFYGLGITAGSGSTAHFSALATLTGSFSGGAIRVTGGTDWSAASWTEGTKTLSISSGDVSGGNVLLASATRLEVTGAATLGAGSFAGNFTNSGTLAFGSSANQTLTGAISGTGSLEKNGAGTLTLNGSINYTGGTVVNSGTLELPGGDWSTGNPWDASGATGAISVGSGASLSFSNGVTGIKNGLTLNGGSVSSRGLTYDGSWGNLFLLSNITAGGSATSTIASQINLSGSRTITVGSASTLNLTGKLNSWNSGGSGITKAGAGTLALSAANGYTGVTDITAGTLQVSNSTALGSGGWDGATMTWIRDGATLSLQGGISLDEHMHLMGTGVGGLGALRSLSGNNTLSLYFGGGGSGPGFALDGNTTIGVDADTLTVTGFYHDSGSFGITKVGAGTLRFSSSSTYSGDTTISAGTLQIGNGGAGGSLYSPSFSSGNLSFGSEGAIVNNGALVYNIAGGALHVNKTISGTGTISVTGDQSVNFTAGTTITTSGSQTYTATATGTRFSGFNLTDNATVTLTSTAGDISMSGMLGTANFNTGNLAINTSAGNGNVVLNTPVGVSGVDYGLNSLTVTAGTGTISLGTYNGYNWGTVHTVSLSGGSVNSTANMQDFTSLTVNNSAASAFSGNLAGGGSVVKNGSGVLTLSGSNSYAGTTSVSQGTLVVNGNNLGATGAVSIASGATLSGSGTIGGATTVSGTHAPGNSPGVQSFAGDLTYDATSTFEWELASSASGSRGTQYDGVNVGGTLSGESGATFKVVLNSGNFAESFWDTNQTWSDIFKAVVDGSGSALSFASVFSNVTWYENTTNMTALTGAQGYFSINGSDLEWTAVPELSNVLIGGLLGVGLLRRRRKMAI